MNVTEAESRHVRDIRRVRDELVRSVRRVDRMAAIMYQSNALSERERELVECERTMSDKAERLIQLIDSKHQTVYEHFLKALQETSQQHLCKLLQDTGYLINQNNNCQQSCITV